MLAVDRILCIECRKQITYDKKHP